MPASKVLLVTYLFPPKGGVGVQRPLSYAKYLPGSNCRVFVLTARNAATAVSDPGLLSEVPADTAVHRVFTPELPFGLRDRIWKGIASPGGPASAAPHRERSLVQSARSAARRMVEGLLWPDPHVVWVPFAVRRARQLVRRHGIDAVLVSVPPFSQLSIGLALKREFPRLKLISEFRDEWLNHYLSSESNVTAGKRRRAEDLERAVAAASDFVVAVTASQTADIRERYPDQPASKFLCIPNGYDPDMFRGFRPRPHGQPGLVVTYVGTVYAHPVCSPLPYLAALERLPEHVRARIETRLIGRVVPEIQPSLSASSACLRQFGFLPQQEAFARLEETDCQLLIVNSATSHAGKLFEYMATGKPILAISPVRGEVARLIRETGTGWCADPEDPAAIAAMLVRALEACRNGGPGFPQPDRAAIQQYQRPRLVAALARAAGL